MKWMSALAVVAAGCGVVGTNGNGDVVSQSRALSGFTGVELRGSLAAKVTQGSPFSVTVVTDSNLQSLVETSIDGNTLVLDDHGIFHATRLEVDVVMPAIATASLPGSGTLDISNANESAEVDLALGGSGQMTFAGSAPTINADLSGSGEMVAKGAAGSLTASLSGSGEMHAQDLVAQSAQLSVTGDGELDAQVVQSVSLVLSGSGELRWTGPAQVASTAFTGSGTISHF